MIYSVLEQSLRDHQTSFSYGYCYADDTQVCISFCPNDRLDQLNAGELLESCITDNRSWTLHDNRLKLNDEKSGLLIIGTPQQLEKVVVTHIARVTPTFTLCLSLGALTRG